MATGFIGISQRLGFAIIGLAGLLGTAASAGATEVSVVGIFRDKAVLVIDGGAPRTLAVGARSPEGVRLVSVEDSGAVVEVGGNRQKLRIGEFAVATTATDTRSAANVTLIADTRGHFHTDGMINGASIRFVVDTGATLIAIGAGDAARAGIDWRRGKPITVMTANGPAQSWRVKLGKVRVGEIVLSDVDAAVMSHDMPVALLGMSFLNRMEMKRDGEAMTLRLRY